MSITQNQKAARFCALHDTPGAFVIPNRWDVGSARILAGLGFQALATSTPTVAEPHQIVQLCSGSPKWAIFASRTSGASGPDTAFWEFSAKREADTGSRSRTRVAIALFFDAYVGRRPAFLSPAFNFHPPV